MASAMGSVITTLIGSLAGLPALSGVTVEGTAVVSGKGYREAVVIGDDGDPESEDEPSFTQEWANMAHTKRSETGDIPCAAIATTGSSSAGTVQDRAFQILAAIETWVKNDPTLGGVVFTAELTEGSSKTFANSAGIAVVVPFSVHYWTHI